VKTTFYLLMLQKIYGERQQKVSNELVPNSWSWLSGSDCDDDEDVVGL
jgi:hypothetical protein